GTLLDRGPDGVVLVEVAGVGYRVHVPSNAHAGLGQVGDAVFLHVHTHVRDDAIILYGFATRDERACFESLIAAHGVGPAVAMNLLAVHRPAALRRVVTTDDIDALTLVPGIGRKTAARLLLELKARLDLPLDEPVGFGGEGGAGNGAPARAEVRAALTSLGYGADETRAALADLPDEGRVEDLLRAALRQLAAAR
ncbi:MAG: Holliday junction branch migration protein RuvA, partial [Acidimicrobiales bacterium]